MSDEQRVMYDPAFRQATFHGPGGFTQQAMTMFSAVAIATALGVPFDVRRQGEPE